MFGRKKSAHEDPSIEDETNGSAAEGPHDLGDVDSERQTLAEGRLDLGSVILEVPDGGQLQVEMTQAGAPQAVHLVTQHGRLTVAAFAAPKSPGQWRDVAAELADSLRADNAPVTIESGRWGREVMASTPGGDIRFIGVDGYRWMIRGVATGPAGSVAADAPLVQQLRAVVQGTVVDRGADPHPVRTALPIVLPAPLVAQLAAIQQQAAAQAAQQAAPPAVQPPPPAPAASAPADDEAAAPAAPTPRRGASGSAMQQLG